MGDEGIIKAVPTDSVRRICTGQVILTLAGACKELIENALDAEARSVDVYIKNFGADTLEVTDDGSGIPESQLEALCLAHQTSKLRSFDDLQNLGSYGFRGEALNALCALSTLTVSTRNVSSAVGFQLKFDRMGKLVEKKPCSGQVGTTVSICGLFDPLPVRRKELMANVRREYAHLVNMVHAYALICTNVRITCHAALPDKKHAIVQTQVSQCLKERICQVFGSKQLQTLARIETVDIPEELCQEYGVTQQQATQLDVKFEGFVSSCTHGKGRSSTDRQYISVNKRPCDFPKVCKTINDVYHQFNRAQYPVIILDISLPKISVDVNVSPDKRSLFISQQKVLLVLIRAAFMSLELCVASAIAWCGVASGRAEHGRHCFSSLAAECPSVNPSHTNASSLATKQRKPTEPPLKQARIEFEPVQQASTCNIQQIQNTVHHDEQLAAMSETGPVEQTAAKSNAEHSATSGVDDLQKDTVVIHQSGHEHAKEACDSTGLPVDHTAHTSEVIMHQIQADAGNRTSAPQDDTPYTSHQLILRNDSGNHPILTQAPTMLDQSWRSAKKIEFSMNSLIESRRLRHAQGRHGQKQFNAKIVPNENETAESELKRLIKKTDFSRMRVVGQFNLGFIICALDDDLFIIDQHASDEKATFEALHKSATLHSQKLIVPQSLDVTPLTESVIGDNMDIFNKNGFDFQLDNNAEPGKRVKLTAIPILQNLTFDRNDIDEIAAVLADFPGMMYRPSRIRKIFASKACRKAVMIGTALNKATMIKIVQHLSQLQDPWSCPHGRPTMRHLSCLKYE